MVILGARGHAIEILDVLVNRVGLQTLYLYDDVTPDMPSTLFETYPILRTVEELSEQLAQDSNFALGIGGTSVRHKFACQLRALGGNMVSVISPTAHIGRHDVELGRGLNIMHGVLISSAVKIGEGALLNAGAAIHHNVIVGEYCEVAPGACLLGHSQIGAFSHIGAGAVVLPRVHIGRNVIVGAGAVVTHHIADNTVVAGVPARPLY